MHSKQREKLLAIRDELQGIAVSTRQLTENDLERVAELEQEIRFLTHTETREDGWRPAEYPDGYQMRNPSFRGNSSGPGFFNGRGTGERFTRTADRVESIFLRFVRTGDIGAQAELQENRASNATDMNITTAADGGDAVPVGHFQGVIAKMRPQSLLSRLNLRQIPGVGTSVDVTVDNEGDDGAFVSTAEVADFDLDAPALSKKTLTLTKYTKQVQLSVELLQDEDSKLLEYLEGYVGSGMAATINGAIVTEALANGTASLTFDAAAAIGAAEVPELLYKLAQEYMNGSPAWLMNRTTEAYIRGLFGTSQFSFGSQEGAASGNGGFGAQLWGLPAVSDSHMPAIGASAKSLLFGDWGLMGYRLPGGMSFLRDPYSLGYKGQVRLLYFFRFSAKVLQSTAFAYGTHPSA